MLIGYISVSADEVVNRDNYDDKTGFIVTALGLSYCTICYIWKSIVPELRYMCGESKINVPLMEVDNSSCSIDIEESKHVKTNASVNLSTGIRG